MKRFLILVILLAVLLVSCAPPTQTSTYVTSPTAMAETEKESGFTHFYLGRIVDLELGYVCYYHKYDGGIWCGKLEK